MMEHKKSQKFSESFLIHQNKDCIKAAVSNNEVSIIAGETGSGKSSEVVQYLYHHWNFEGLIVCTQPRKVAANTLAHYISELVCQYKHCTAACYYLPICLPQIPLLIMLSYKSGKRYILFDDDHEEDKYDEVEFKNARGDCLPR